MKKTIKENKTNTIICIIAIIVIIFLKFLLTILCEKTNSLLAILLDMNTGTVFFSVFIWNAILFSNIKDSIKTNHTNLRNTMRYTTFKYLLLGGMILLFIPQLFPFTRKFEYIKINDKKTIRLQYNYSLLCDAISGDTESLTLDPEDFELKTHSYSSGGRYPNTLTAYYACFAGKRMYLYNTSLGSYINLCKTYHKQLEIVYHKNSGIIQTINGIKLYDKSAFLNSAEAITQEEETKLEEQKAIAEAEEEKEIALFSAFFESEGKNYEEIVRQLEKDGFENTYKTVYISTQYYEIGEIAMFDNFQKTVYVVRDNNKEEMLLIPPFPQDGTLTEITQILDDAGIAWEYHCMGSITENKKNRDHSKDILNTYPRSPGTPVTKDYVFRFTVNHIDQ